MKIAEVADRTGFSPTTLRYYEEIGLVPPAARTGAGYREYDDRAVDRLLFVARAKQLGCTLEEIAELTATWDGDECAPVQDRLRTVVLDKIAATERRAGELAAFAADLRATAASLALEPTDGPCGDDCGCTAAATTASADPDIVCTLGSDDVPARVAEWRAVLEPAVSRTTITGGVRVAFDAAEAPLDDLARLMVAEQSCCRFFSFALTVDERGIALEVTAPADASSIVAELFGEVAGRR